MSTKKYTFQGGVHPAGQKDLSKGKATQEFLPQGNLIYPLSQHIGAPAKPIVKVGDLVLAGQMIAEAGGFVSAPIYASVSGKVKAIKPTLTVTGGVVNAIEIENDHEFKSVEYPEPTDVTTLNKEEILNRIGNAGVVGMGGAGFPTKVKLSPKNPESIKYILVNAAECEPYITCDYREMMEHGDMLINGLKVVLQIFPQAKGIICVEDNKMDAIANLEKLAANESRIEVYTMVTKYPQGSERHMIKAATGIEINSSQLPADAGCIVDNVATMIAIYNAVVLQKPVTHRVFTVTGDAAANPGNYRIPIGSMVQEIIDFSGGFKVQPEKVISGGPMMGFAMFDLNVPTTKTSSCALCMSKDEVKANEPINCINCGRCVSACPEKLIPAKLAKFASKMDKASFEKYYGMECVECGSCAFICPSHRPLVQNIKMMRQTILADRRAAAAAARAAQAKGGK